MVLKVTIVQPAVLYLVLLLLLFVTDLTDIIIVVLLKIVCVWRRRW